LGGVEPKAEIVSDDVMSELSKYPNDDLQNKEKNQQFIDGKQGFFIQKGDKGTNRQKHQTSWKRVN